MIGRLIVFGVFLACATASKASIIKKDTGQVLEKRESEGILEVNISCRHKAVEKYTQSTKTDIYGKEENTHVRSLVPAKSRKIRSAEGVVAGTVIIGASIGAALGGGVGAVIGGAIGFVVGIFACCNKPKNNEPPQFTSCPGDVGTIVTPWNTSRVRVTWEHPTARDPEDGNVQVTRVGDSDKSIFEAGTHLIVYEARDSRGSGNTCNVKFVVEVPTCYPPEPINHGKKYTSSDEYFHGTVVSYICNLGFEIKGSSRRICKTNKLYDFDSPTCQRVRCPRSHEIAIAHGKPSCYPSDLVFETKCRVSCDSGYGVKDMSNATTICQANRDWSANLPDCLDIKKPEIKCPDTIRKWSDRGKTYTGVTWEIPTATDNSGKVPVVQQIDGPAPGSNFFANNSKTIVYMAKDEQGNNATCDFLVIVETIYCEPPVLSGRYLEYNCPDNFRYGSTCSITCQGSYEVGGARNMTCEIAEITDDPYWDFGDKRYPYCKQTECKPLTPPDNGALACDTWLFGTMCQMQCQEGFDIPAGIVATGTFVCSTASGLWRPFSEVPGCIEPAGSVLRLPGELFYYSGNCSDEETQKEIRENFIEHMKELQKTGYDGVCVNASLCNVENVEVFCGNRTSRQRRSIDKSLSRNRRQTQYPITVTFVITVKVVTKPQNISNVLGEAEDTIQKLSGLIAEEVKNGSLTVDGLTVETDSVSFGDVSVGCEEGFVFKQSSLSCVGCPLGEYFNSTGMCDKCPINTYRELATSVNCTQCPKGAFTRKSGSTALADCKYECQPGYYSSDGLEPCSSCRVGFFQPDFNATFCNKCPTGRTTLTTASQSENNCQEYDLIFRSNGSYGIYEDIGINFSNLTLIFWFKFPETSTGREQFVIGDDVGIFSFQLNNEDMVLEYNSMKIEIDTKVDKKEWTHYGLSFFQSHNSTDVTIYTQGEVSVFESFPRDESISTDFSKISLRWTESTGVARLTGFSLVPWTESNATIAMLSKTCSAYVPDERLIDDLFNLHTWNLSDVAISVSSTCDAINECLSMPCGTHKCMNMKNGYICECDNGYSGKNCKIAPDYCLDNKCDNKATCVNWNNTYICHCAPGFKGTFCSDEIVDGQWSSWNAWNQCTASCGGGIRSRIRRCDNPEPDEEGKNCSGNNTEVEICNTGKCPECPEFPLVQGTISNCTIDGDNEVCKVSCEPGMYFASNFNPVDEYICGERTNYKWNSIPPSCVEIHPPKYLETKTSVVYPNLPCKYKTEAKQYVDNTMEGLQCVHNSTCNVSVAMIGCEMSSAEHETENVILEVILKSDLENSSLDLESLFKTGNVSKGLYSFLVTLADITLSSVELNNTEEIYRLNLDGATYDADMSTVNLIGELSCPPGKIPQETFCVDCPLGTFYKDNICNLCPYGKFQNKLGQTSCKSCPDKLFTEIIGSKNETDCNVYCDEGTYFMKGNCIKCKNGTYQDNTGQTECKECPNGFFSAIGSTSISDCYSTEITSSEPVMLTTPDTDSHSSTPEIVTQPRSTAVKTERPTKDEDLSTETTSSETVMLTTHDTDSHTSAPEVVTQLRSTTVKTERPTKDEDLKSEKNTVIVIATIVPIVLLVCLILAISFFIYRTRTKKLNKRQKRYEVKAFQNITYSDSQSAIDGKG